MAQTPQRLKRRHEFLHVARAGRKWAAPGLVLQVLEHQPKTRLNSSDEAVERPMERLKTSASQKADETGIRVGFTVTRKIGGAVIRNRAKRRLRAAVETVMPTHAAPGRDYVVIGRAKTNTRPFSELVGDLETALRKLNAWQDVDTSVGAAENGSKHGRGQRI